VTRYLVGRAAQSIFAIAGVMTIVFVVMRLSGDPTLLLVPEGATREQIDALRRQLGFDRPILVQFADYLWTLTQLDPVYYMIGLVRYGFLGYSDTSIPLSLIFLLSAALILFSINYSLFARGYRLRV
jgi:ABC-type dipeptide/oligopeptide/nickel transport system permease component